jgi:hypothetical protein
MAPATSNAAPPATMAIFEPMPLLRRGAASEGISFGFWSYILVRSFPFPDGNDSAVIVFGHEFHESSQIECENSWQFVQFVTKEI